MIPQNIKFNASSLRQLASSVESNRVEGGDGSFAVNTPHGSVVSTPVSIKTFQNTETPKLFSIKSAPAQNYIHVRDGVEYPSLYVYLGPSVAFALETVNIQNNWIPTGTHPKFFMYGNFSKANYTTTYKRNPDGSMGEALNATWTTTKSFTDCLKDSETRSLDGWYELPTSTAAAMPLYAICFSGPGLNPTLALVTIDRPFSETQSSSLSGVAFYKFEPDFSKLHDIPKAYEGQSLYHGLIGDPILLYDLNPYSTDELVGLSSAQFLAVNGKVNFPKFDIINVYNANNALEFKDYVDTLNYAFRPVLLGSLSGNAPALSSSTDAWRYAFAMPFQPNKWKGSGNYTNGETYSELSNLVDVLSVDEGTLYNFKTIGANGYNNTFKLLSFKDELLSSFGQNCAVQFDPKKPPVTNKGRTPCVLVVPDYNGSLSSVDIDKPLRLVLNPIMIDNVNGDGGPKNCTVYYPRITTQAIMHVVSSPVGKMAPEATPINACQILAQAKPNTMTFPTIGTMPINNGENYFRKWGQLCPKYENVSLVNTFVSMPGDSWIDVQPSQYQAFALSDDPGTLSGQFGSIQINNQLLSSGIIANYYSLYHFAEAPSVPLSSFYPLSSISVDISGDVSSTSGDVSVITEVILSAVPKIDIVARVQNRISGENNPVPVDGAHLEYIALSSIGGLGGDYWLRGGTYETNYGQSFRLGDGVSWITVSYSP